MEVSTCSSTLPLPPFFDTGEGKGGGVYPLATLLPATRVTRTPLPSGPRRTGRRVAGPCDRLTAPRQHDQPSWRRDDVA